MTNTTKIGNVTEGMVLAGLLRIGKNVLMPFGGGLRYDLAFDEDGILKRVQCKSGVLRDGSIRFNVVSTQRDTKVRTNYRNDADFFGVYCAQLGTTYLIPVAAVPARSIAYIRVEPTRNRQVKGVKRAEQFLI